MNVKVTRWIAIIALLGIAIYCDFQIGNSILNAILDIVLTFAVFLVTQRAADEKTASLQAEIHDIEQRLKHQEELANKHDNPDRVESPSASSNILWEHAVKR